MGSLRNSRLRLLLALLILVVVVGGFLVPLILRNPLPGAEAADGMAAVVEPSDTIDWPSAVPILYTGGTFRVVWRPNDTEPATHDGLLCVTADGPGQICAPYAAGQRPADGLVREIERRGYHVDGVH